MAAVSGGNMNYLAASTIRLLGSTQVITSVYSVIKELVENSLDAGAKAIEVKLDNYGLDKIEVRDNGSGIHPSDIPFIAKSHYTSKISSHADLESLASYGFRGEALASLCAVSEVSVTTKTQSEDVSQTYILNSEGNVTSTVPSHLGQGTTVCAKNLFKNLPVRKQYHSSVKKKKEDLKNVENLLLAFSVILPAVRFSLRHNKELVWQKTSLESTAATVLKTILGKGIMSQMEWNRRSLEDPKMELELCAPKAGSDVSSLSRSTPDRSFLCINGRPVVVKEIDKVIRQYYNNCHACETNRHPVYYLCITLPAKDLDVNLDPNKTAVMATSMPTLLEQLEEILLFIYGPLDQAPSWKYKENDEGKEKTSSALKSQNGASVRVLERLRKTSTEQGRPTPDLAEKDSFMAEKNSIVKPSSSSAVIVFEAAASVGKRHANHIAVGSESDSVNRVTPVHTSSKGDGAASEVHTINKGNESTTSADIRSKSKHTFVDAVHVKESSKNSISSDQQDKQSCVRDDHNSNILKEGFFNSRFPSSVVQDLEKAAESAPSESFRSSVEGRDVGESGSVRKVVTGAEGTGVKIGGGQTGDEQAGGEQTGGQMGGGQTSLDVSKKTDAQPGTVGWNLGTSIRSADGSVVQPIRLLAPSPGQLPGKRPLPMSSELQPPPEKRGRKLSPAKSTLYDVINNTTVKRPLSARDFFFQEKRSSVVELNPEADYDEVTDILATMWEELPDESRVAFREKCWNDTQRYNKEVASAKNVPLAGKVGKVKASTSSKAKGQMSVRDMVAASSTQPSPVRTLKKVIPSAHVTEVCFSMAHLQESLSCETAFSTVYFREERVLGYLPSCQVWVCGRGKELCLLNAHRLSEAMVLQRLMNQHRLPVHHCQPVTLSPSNTGGFWSTLETLAGNSATVDNFSYLSDSRITHNGFDVKCWKVGDGPVCGELVGLCGDVPTYGVKDLSEVLGLISKDPLCTLAQCRPLKVSNYLKGEAVRMVRQQAGDRSLEDVQDMLEESKDLLPASCHSCLHDRPFFHTLLADIQCAIASPEDSLSETEQV